MKFTLLLLLLPFLSLSAMQAPAKRKAEQLTPCEAIIFKHIIQSCESLNDVTKTLQAVTCLHRTLYNVMSEPTTFRFLADEIEKKFKCTYDTAMKTIGSKRAADFLAYQNASLKRLPNEILTQILLFLTEKPEQNKDTLPGCIKNIKTFLTLDKDFDTLNSSRICKPLIEIVAHNYFGGNRIAAAHILGIKSAKQLIKESKITQDELHAAELSIGKYYLHTCPNYKKAILYLDKACGGPQYKEAGALLDLMYINGAAGYPYPLDTCWNPQGMTLNKALTIACETPNPIVKKVAERFMQRHGYSDRY